MTRNTWARIAGFMFLFYIATALPVIVAEPSTRVAHSSDEPFKAGGT